MVGSTRARLALVTMAATVGMAVAGGGGVALAGMPTACAVRIVGTPGVQATLQAAVDAAADGAVLRVAGTCTETVTIDGRVTLRGVVVGASGTPTIAAPEGSRAIDVLAGGDVTIAKLHIVGGTLPDRNNGNGSPGGAIRTAGALRITSSAITGGVARKGGGIGVTETGSLVLGNGAKVTANTSTWRGGGIWSAGAVTLTGTARVFQNESTNDGGGGVASDQGSFVMKGRARIDHNAARYAGGFANLPGATAVIAGRASVDHHTVPDQSGAMEIGGSLTLKGHASVHDNSTDGPGGAADIWGSIVVGGYATITGNRAAQGGALAIDGGTSTVAGHAVIRGNEAVLGGDGTGVGGGIAIWSGTLTLAGGARVMANHADVAGGGVFNDGATLEGACGTGRVKQNTAPTDPNVSPACPAPTVALAAR